MKESGERWDEPLPIFKQGTININFKDNLIGFTAGDVVNGSIDVELKEDMPEFREL